MKSVIITGANSGLGFQCSKVIAQSNNGWHIIMACRSLEKGNKARQGLLALYPEAKITVMALDLGSLESVHSFVEEFANSDFPPLHGLINNAGLQVMSGVEYTKDGFELTFGTNHLGHFLLTNLLMPFLSRPARRVVVSSGTHDPQTLEGKFNKPLFLGASRLAYPTSENEMSGMQRYATSKLANLLFAYHLADRCKNENIAVNAFDPAAVPGTNLLQSIKSPWIRGLIRFSTRFSAFFGVRISTPETSGAAMARLLLDEKLNGVTGKYYQVFEEKCSSNQSYDRQLARELWEDSIKLTGMND